MLPLHCICIVSGLKPTTSRLCMYSVRPKPDASSLCVSCQVSKPPASPLCICSVRPQGCRLFIVCIVSGLQPAVSDVSACIVSGLQPATYHLYVSCRASSSPPLCCMYRVGPQLAACTILYVLSQATACRPLSLLCSGRPPVCCRWCFYML